MSKVVRILRRDIGDQFNTSRNLKEGWRLRLRRIFWASVYLLKGLAIAVFGMRHEHLGSQVFYKGRKCFVSNWAGHVCPTLTDGSGFYEQNCNRRHITNVVDLAELKHRFEAGLSFYLGNWFSVNVNRRLYGNRKAMK